MRIFQRGFNFSQDGPGNRLVYHLQGCNLRCPWCSNPEGLDLHGGTPAAVEELLDGAASSFSTAAASPSPAAKPRCSWTRSWTF